MESAGAKGWFMAYDSSARSGSTTLTARPLAKVLCEPIPQHRNTAAPVHPFAGFICCQPPPPPSGSLLGS